MIKVNKGELEMKRGSDGRKSLYYLDKAVEFNDYDDTALVARSRSEEIYAFGPFMLNNQVLPFVGPKYGFKPRCSKSC